MFGTLTTGLAVIVSDHRVSYMSFDLVCETLTNFQAQVSTAVLGEPHTSVVLVFVEFLSY